MEMKKQTKKKIAVGYIVNSNVGELETFTRGGRSRRTRKEVVGCVHSVVGKKKFLIQFEDGKKKEISSSSFVFLSSKEEVEMDEPISHFPEKEQGELLTINGDPEVEEPCMFVKGMYLSVFYYLCYAKDISADMSEDQVMEERYPDLNEEEDIRLDAIREEHCRGVADHRWELPVLRYHIIRVNHPYPFFGVIFG